MKKISTIAAALFLATGCGGEVRYITAEAWIVPPGAGAAAAAPAAPAAPAPTPAPEGAAAAAAPAAPSAPAAPAPPTGNSIQSNYYVTYWEGRCGGLGGGCSRGTSKVKRCHVNPDNSATCVDEPDINRVLGAD
jgi:nucleoid-associated protein YgaU